MTTVLEAPVYKQEEMMIDLGDMVEGEVRMLSLKGPNGTVLSLRITATPNGVRSDIFPKSQNNQHELVAVKGGRMHFVEADVYSLEIKS